MTPDELADLIEAELPDTAVYEPRLLAQVHWKLRIELSGSLVNEALMVMLRRGSVDPRSIYFPVAAPYSNGLGGEFPAWWELAKLADSRRGKWVEMRQAKGLRVK
jgi:hypothetical protein